MSDNIIIIVCSAIALGEYSGTFAIVIFNFNAVSISTLSYPVALIAIYFTPIE